MGCGAHVQHFWRLTYTRHHCDTPVVRPVLTKSVGATTNGLLVGFAHSLLFVSLAGDVTHLLQSGILENQKYR